MIAIMMIKRRSIIIGCAFLEFQLLLVESLLQASTFTGSISQVIQFRSPHLGMSIYNDFLESRRPDQECAFNADTITSYSAYCETCIITAAASADYSTSKFLNSLVLAFLNPNKNLDNITWIYLGYIGVFSGFY
jgi:hypothetical protein